MPEQAVIPLFKRLQLLFCCFSWQHAKAIDDLESETPCGTRKEASRSLISGASCVLIWPSSQRASRSSKALRWGCSSSSAAASRMPGERALPPLTSLAMNAPLQTTRLVCQIKLSIFVCNQGLDPPFYLTTQGLNAALVTALLATSPSALSAKKRKPINLPTKCPSTKTSPLR